MIAWFDLLSGDGKQTSALKCVNLDGEPQAAQSRMVPTSKYIAGRGGAPTVAGPLLGQAATGWGRCG